MKSAEQQRLTTRVTEALALALGCSEDELGRQWREYAEAFSEVATTHLRDDYSAIGRLAYAAMRLP